MVMFVSVFPFLPAEISKSNISILLPERKFLVLMAEKEMSKFESMTEVYENSNLEGESELSEGFFYLNQTGYQTTSEGNLVSEGIHPPDFRTFS